MVSWPLATKYEVRLIAQALSCLGRDELKKGRSLTSVGGVSHKLKLSKKGKEKNVQTRGGDLCEFSRKSFQGLKESRLFLSSRNFGKLFGRVNLLLSLATRSCRQSRFY